MTLHRSLPFLAPLGLILGLLAAPTGPVAAAAGPEPVTRANYEQAFHYSDAFLGQFVYDMAVIPHWIGKTDSFWYAYRTSTGTRYWRVDPQQGTKVPLFDPARLAARLCETTGKPLDAAQLPLTRLTVNDDGTAIQFVVDDTRYGYDLRGDKLSRLGKAPPAPPAGPGRRSGFGRRFQGQRGDQERRRQFARPPGESGARTTYRVYAPDRKAYILVRNHNLYLVETAAQPFARLLLPTWQTDLGGVLGQLWRVTRGAAWLQESQAIPLSTDGVEGYSFASMGTFGAGMDDQVTPPRVEWSPDSKAFFATRVDGRGVPELFLVNSIAQPRPTLERYKYPLPGEPAARRMEVYVGSRLARKLVRVQPRWQEEVYSNLHWGKTSDELRFVRRDRLVRHGELAAADIHTGATRCLVREAFERADVRFQPVEYVAGSNEMLWWSERSGWGHFYLYDGDGKFENAVTAGPYRASRIVAVDPQSRLVYFQGNGHEPGENVYFQHLYRVHLDGSGLTLLDPGDANHQSVLSPSRRFVVDNSSRVDQAPVAVLRDAGGRPVLKLEEADLSRLYTVGWKMPERFVVKAADGVTDLFGNLWKPFDFDPKRKYPVIVHVYPGPQNEGVTHTFAAVGGDQQLAQLGFLVVQVGHRGGAPTRSKAYASYGYGNLRDYGLADKKAAIEQLAARFPFLDLERVGIYGHSGGGFMSAAAILQQPYNDFFKAAVASSGNHDNNLYNNGWAERYHGMSEAPAPKAGPGAGDKAADGKSAARYVIRVPTNAELAANLKGALLLVHGELDNNVHPAHTLRLVDALIRANKRFDLLILPGKRHGYGDYQPYFQQRMWDFFADHLLGDRPTGADIYAKGRHGQP